MKKLDRGLAQKPAFLSKFSYEKKTWDNVSSKRKKRIWQELYKFQDIFCAYCELPAERDGIYKGHVEHFYHKGYKKGEGFLYKSLTFEWNNLFGCCASHSHCGHFKDQVPANNNGYSREYNPNFLIKPDIDDPEKYLLFLDSGIIEPRSGVSGKYQYIAKETIKALNLDCPKLRTSRRNQIKKYRERLDALYSNAIVCGYSDIQLAAEMQIIEDYARQDFHRTAIKQVVI